MKKLDDRYVRPSGLTALTFVGSDPNVLSVARVTGITTPIDSDPLILDQISDSGGYSRWGTAGGVGGFVLDNETTIQWQVFYEGVYQSVVDSEAASPDGLTFGAPTIGAGPPSVEIISAPVATHLGQLCRASTAWWIWNGTAWIPFATLDGSPVAYSATLTAYRKLTVSGADGSETITISAL